MMKSYSNFQEYEERQAFYNSKEWKSTREIVLRNEPFCVICKKEDKLTPAVDVDHIIDIKDEPEKRLLLTNLQPLCKKCHSFKTYSKVKEKWKKLNTALKPLLKWERFL